MCLMTESACVDVGVGCCLRFATGKEQPGGALDWLALALSWKQD